MVVPAVIEEVDATVERGADHADSVLRIGRVSYVITTHTDNGDLLTGAAQSAVRNGTLGGISQLVRKRTDHAGDSNFFKEITAIHNFVPLFSSPRPGLASP